MQPPNFREQISHSFLSLQICQPSLPDMQKETSQNGVVLGHQWRFPETDRKKMREEYEKNRLLSCLGKRDIQYTKLHQAGNKLLITALKVKVSCQILPRTLHVKLETPPVQVHAMSKFNRHRCLFLQAQLEVSYSFIFVLFRGLIKRT